MRASHTAVRQVAIFASGVVGAVVISNFDGLVPRAGHVDLYDRVGLIPFDKLTSFFRSKLA